MIILLITAIKQLLNSTVSYKQRAICALRCFYNDDEKWDVASTQLCGTAHNCVVLLLVKEDTQASPSRYWQMFSLKLRGGRRCILLSFSCGIRVVRNMACSDHMAFISLLQLFNCRFTHCFGSFVLKGIRSALGRVCCLLLVFHFRFYLLWRF